MMSGRPALLSPRWLLIHLLVAALAAGMTALGLWQLRRLEEVRALQTRMEQRLAAEPVPLDEIGRTEEFRRVTVTGRYAPAEEVLQRSRSHRGQNGWHVLTPLETSAGEAILVRRGWIPLRSDPPAPPAGQVTVTGFLEASDEQPDLLGPRDPDRGRLDTVFHADVSRLDRQTEASLFPMILHLRSQDPPQPDGMPVPADVPEPDDTRHLSYAVQWFSFAAIGVVAYGAFLRRRVRDGGRGPDGPDRAPDAEPAPRSPAEVG